MAAAIRVLLFAHYAELVGREQLTVRVATPATVRDVVRAVRGGVAGGVALPEQPLAAVNAAHAPLDTPVREGDEVALLPPLAGG
jgi:molybdopterin converting factor small subunit